MRYSITLRCPDRTLPAELLRLDDALSIVRVDEAHPQVRVGQPLLGGVAQ